VGPGGAIDGSGRSTVERRESGLSKVPEVTAYFWIVKALTTALGESVSDYLVHTIAPVLAVLIGFVAFSCSLAIQLRARRYGAWAYWTAVAMVGIFGTMAADVLHVGFGVPYALSTVLFIVVLAGVFSAWYRSEGTLSIHSITTRRREMFYWAAVVSTFAMGTAVGDLAANSVGLGYLVSGLVFAVLIVLPGVGYRWFGLNGVLAFWLTYVLTRPLGASFADWIGKPVAIGGLGVGSGRVGPVLAVTLCGFIAFLAATKVDTPDGRTSSDVSAGMRP
jgi:uncharacterized membrane-anchored protein